MSIIIAGRCQEQDQAAEALRVLMDSGFSNDEMTTFYVNQQGQHALHKGGGDEKASPGARDAGKGAVTGASIGGAVGLAAGVAAIPEDGPAGLGAAAGIGAYPGSLDGAMDETAMKRVADTRTRKTRTPENR